MEIGSKMTKKNKPFKLNWTIRKQTIDELCIRSDDPNIKGLAIHEINNTNAGDCYSHEIIAKGYDNENFSGTPIFTITSETTHDGNEHPASGGVFVKYKDEKGYREGLGSRFTEPTPWTEEQLSAIEEKHLRAAIALCDDAYPNV